MQLAIAISIYPSGLSGGFRGQYLDLVKALIPAHTLSSDQDMNSCVPLGTLLNLT